MTENIEKEKIEKLKELIDKAQKIVITCHLSPDGDAMGSTLGLRRALTLAGKTATVLTPDVPPRYLTFLPGAEDIAVFSRNEMHARWLLKNADLVFCLDYNEPKRIDLMADMLMASHAPKVMIDHHLNPSDFPDVVLSHPSESSTSVLIYRVLSELGMRHFIDRDAAMCIYTGMMTDTGNFSYNSSNAYIYEVIADLVRRGIDKDAIYRTVYFQNTANRLRLNGYAIDKKMEVFDQHRCALITLTREELNSYHYQKGDTEDLVNKPLTMATTVWSVFLREESNYIKVSMRSKGDFPVNMICHEHFNGGGHLNAAGGEFYGTLDEAVATLHKIMPLYDQYLHK